MKTPEDEAFDEMAKRQGSWGGGYQAKRKMATDKMQECPNLKNCEGACFQCAYFNAETGKTEYPVAQPAQEPVAWMCSAFGDDEVEYGPHQECENCVPLYTHPPQPAQEPDALTIAYQSGFYDGKKAAQRPWVGLTEKDFSAINQSCLTKL